MRAALHAAPERGSASEKEIAAQLGLAATTVHQYAKAVYRKFGVKGRVRLMSLWLNRMG